MVAWNMQTVAAAVGVIFGAHFLAKKLKAFLKQLLAWRMQMVEVALQGRIDLLNTVEAVQETKEKLEETLQSLALMQTTMENVKKEAKEEMKEALQGLTSVKTTLQSAPTLQALGGKKQVEK